MVTQVVCYCHFLIIFKNNALHCTALHYIVSHCTVSCCIFLMTVNADVCKVCYTIYLLFVSLQWYTVLYCIVLYCIVLYCIVLYCIVLHCIVLYCLALHGIVLCKTISTQNPLTVLLCDRIVHPPNFLISLHTSLF